MSKMIIYADGASRGNPGLSAVGFVIKGEDGTILAQEGVFLGFGTNNEAEYRAVKLALEKLIRDLPSRLPATVEFRLDSQLITNQLAGRYKVKNLRLKIFFDQIKLLEKKVGKVDYKNFPRERNLLADQLANNSLDDYEKSR